MPFATVEAQTVAYSCHAKYADAARPPLVLIHGAGGSHLHWPPRLRRLQETAVYAPDLPGHGRSSGRGRSSIHAYMTWLAEFVATLGLTRFVLAGHSMGGAIALEFAIQHANQLAGLALLATGARLPVAPTLLSGLRDDFEAATKLITQLAYSAETSDEMRQRFLKQLAAYDPAVLSDDFVACHRFDQQDRLAAIQMPALLIYGREDRLTPAKYGEYLHDHLPNSTLHLLDGAGHMVMLERPNPVIELFEQFLESVSTA